MKDLFKGHHPWLLVLVIAVDIFSALVIRHSILSKGTNVPCTLALISSFLCFSILICKMIDIIMVIPVSITIITPELFISHVQISFMTFLFLVIIN